MPRIIHFEIGADDPERAIDFYQKTFGWKIDKWDGGDYWLVATGPDNQPGINGGIFKKPGPIGANIVNTLDVPSVDDSMAKVTENGGKIIEQKMAVPGVGWLAYCQDTEGNAFGIMQMDKNAKS